MPQLRPTRVAEQGMNTTVHIMGTAHEQHMSDEAHPRVGNTVGAPDVPHMSMFGAQGMDTTVHTMDTSVVPQTSGEAEPSDGNTLKRWRLNCASNDGG